MMPPVSLSWPTVCRARLRRQGLSAPWATGTDPADVVAALAGQHAQVMSAAELAVGLRLEGVTRQHVRRALWEDHTLVKAFGPRGTVHLLPAAELPMWTAAFRAAPRPPNSHPRHVQMTPDQFEAVVAAIDAAALDAELTVDELDEAVVAATGSWAGDLVMEAFQGKWPRWRQALPTAGLRGAVVFGPMRGRKVTYTSPRRWIPGFIPAADKDRALSSVVLRFLHAYGPATAERLARWLTVPVPWARDVLAAVVADADVVEVEVAGELGWLLAGDLPADPPDEVRDKVPDEVRLLPYFDPYAYSVGNRRDLLYPGVAAQRAAGNFQVVLVGGVVAGIWHHKRSGKRIAVTVEPFADLDTSQRRQLDDQVERVAAILEGAPELTIGPVTVGGHA